MFGEGLDGLLPNAYVLCNEATNTEGTAEMKTFSQLAADRRALVEAGTIHPASLIDLARDRMTRLREWDSPAEWMKEAEALFAEGKAKTEEFNRARGYIQ